MFAGFFAIFCITILQVFSGVSEIRCCHLFFLGFQSHLISDLTFLFVVTFSFGIAGAAVATVISPNIAGIGLMLYFLFRYSDLCPAKKISHGKKRTSGRFFLCLIYVFAAVRYELWHPDDTGISQFFWYNDYGSVFRGGQN